MSFDSEDIVAQRLKRAIDLLAETEILIENGLWNTAVNRFYYACFHAVTALLYHNGHETRTHRGVQQVFGLQFVRTGIIDKESGRFYAALFDMRQNADYEAAVEYDEEDVQKLVLSAGEFVSKISNLLSER